MEYCLKNPHRFTEIPDPYGNGRRCFQFRSLQPHDLFHLSTSETKIQIIIGNIIYFSK